MNGFLPDYQTWRPQIQRLLTGSDKILKTYIGKDVLKVGNNSYTFEEFISLPSERLTYYVIMLRDEIYMPFFVETNKKHLAVKFSNAIEKLEAEMNTRMVMLEALYHMNKFYEIQYHWELDAAELVPKFVFESSPDESIIRVNNKNKEKIPCRAFLFQDMLVLASINKKPERKLYYLGGLSVHPSGDCNIVLSTSPTKHTLLITPSKAIQNKYLQLLTAVMQPQFFDSKTTQMVAKHIRTISSKDDKIESYYGVPLPQLYKEKKWAQFMQPDNDSNIIFQKSETAEVFQTRIIRGASLPKLIEYLTHPTLVDNQFLYAFLLTYNSFTNAEEFLDLLADRYETPPKEGCSIKEFTEFRDNFLFPMRLRVCQVLKYWIENHSYDFRNNTKLCRKYSDFIEQHVAKTKFGHLADNLRIYLDSCTRKRDTFRAQRISGKLILGVKAQLPPAMTPSRLRTFMRLPKANKEEMSGVLEWPSMEIARQMTLIEYQIFEKIQPKECLSQAWNKANRKEVAPNITEMIDRTNRVVNWVAAEILQYDKTSKRTYAIRKFIKIASALRKLNNFNGCKEIVGGLRSIPVSRLTKTWEQVPSKFMTDFQALEDLLHQSKNFKNMRAALKATNTHTLPYIGMFLTDLTFIEDGNKDQVDGLINFFKRQKYAVVIREMLRLQSEPYMFTVVPDLQAKLRNIPNLDENKLLEQSYKLEAKK
jgi:hypothetical protein